MADLSTLDFVVIALYVVFALVVGSMFAKKASTGIHSFFVGDRKLPWWLAGTSIVATTFAADTPLAVTGIVANDGISGNWIWWSWAVAHLTSTFFFARLWRRSGVITDAEITELRYRGRPAAALRAFKAVYFGIFINCLTMAWVIAAMVKISRAFFPEIPPSAVITACVVVSVAYTTMGGFRGVVITDIVQFALGMFGAIVLAWLAIDLMGGMGALPAAGAKAGSGLLGALAQTLGDEVEHTLAFMPGSDHPTLPVAYFLVLLFAGWWRYAEGNGYIVQRLAASKDEGHAQGAALWFSVAHNALRPWPWILVGLVSLALYPKVSADNRSVTAVVEGDAHTFVLSPAYLDAGTHEVSLAGAPDGCGLAIGGVALEATGKVENDTGRAYALPTFEPGAHDVDVVCAGQKVAHFDDVPVGLSDREMAYPLLMRKVLPSGLLGLVLASLLAAFMSTIDTHTNWGASYLVNDVYRRFLRREEDERHYVRVSRLCIVLMAILAGISALFIGNIASVWKFLITLGSGLGSVTAARWYWSRVTPHAEFAALGVTTVLAVSLQLFCTPTLFGRENAFFLFEVSGWVQILVVAGASLATWIPVSLFGPQNDPDVLRTFEAKVRPPGPGWANVRDVGARRDSLFSATWRFVAGAVVVFATLFGLGELVLGSVGLGVGLLAAAVACLVAIIRAGDHTAPTGETSRESDAGG